MKITNRTVMVILVAGISLQVFCQKSMYRDNIKSITILEEKQDMLVKKQLKESETYYDTRGNIIEEITYKQGKVDKHFKYQYDKDNNKIKEEEFDPSGRLTEMSEYKIENGLRVEKIVFTPDKKIRLRKIYQYTSY